MVIKQILSIYKNKLKHLSISISSPDRKATIQLIQKEASLKTKTQMTKAYTLALELAEN